MNICTLKADDVGYALIAWQEAHKTSPQCRRAPWWAYRREYGDAFKKLVDDPTTVLLGAYSDDDVLLGFLIMTPGKRVSALHWCQVKHALRGTVKQKLSSEQRRQIFFALIEAAELGQRFVYTLRGPRVAGPARSLDELLVNDLRAKGITATFVALKEYLR